MKNRDGYQVFFPPEGHDRVLLPVALRPEDEKAFRLWVRQHYRPGQANFRADLPPCDVKSAATAISALLALTEIAELLQPPQPSLRRPRRVPGVVEHAAPLPLTPEQQLEQVRAVIEKHRTRSIANPDLPPQMT